MSSPRKHAANLFFRVLFCALSYYATSPPLDRSQASLCTAGPRLSKLYERCAVLPNHSNFVTGNPMKYPELASCLRSPTAVNAAVPSCAALAIQYAQLLGQAADHFVPLCIRQPVIYAAGEAATRAPGRVVLRTEAWNSREGFVVPSHSIFCTRHRRWRGEPLNQHPLSAAVFS